jgi:hypothetical protein
MNGPTTATNSSNKIALLALISLIPVFLFVITNGWASIIAPFVHISDSRVLNDIAAYSAGFLISVVAAILAWAVASERARLKYEDSARFTWIAYLGVLIAISALGTMNWLFKVSETATFIKEVAVTTELKLTELEQTVNGGIRLPQTELLKANHDRERRDLQTNLEQLKGDLAATKSNAELSLNNFKKQILQLFESFEAEVKNPLKAGCGEVARGYLTEIQQRLPDLRLPSGDCSKADAEVVVRTYRDAIDKALANWANAQTLNCEMPETWRNSVRKIHAITNAAPPLAGNECTSVETALRSIERSTETYIANMPEYAPGENGLAELKQASSLLIATQVSKVRDLYMDAEKLNKTIASPILKEAWSEYGITYKKLVGAIDDTALAKLPESIDDQRIDKIGNVTNTLEILASRYNHLSTYLIILAGILFDVILISFFYRVEISRNRKRQPTGHEKRLEEIRSTLKSV